MYLGPFYFAPRDREWEPRAYAASIIRECGSDAVVEMLTGFLTEAQAAHRSPSIEDDMAAGALADIAPDGALDLFIQLLAEGGGRVRAHAARGLGKIGASRAVPLLLGTLIDPKEPFEARCQSATALANIQGIDALRSLLNEAVDPTLRMILTEEIPDREPHQPSAAVDSVQMEVERLAALEPAELL
jgi:HEAT repeat protein